MDVILYLKEKFDLSIVKTSEDFNRCEVYIKIDYEAAEENLGYLEEFFSRVNERDKVVIDLKVDGNTLESARSTEELDDLTDVIKYAAKSSNESECIVVVTIKKKIVDDSITVYNFNSFREYLSKLNLKATFSKLNELIKQKNRLKFEVQNEGIEGGTKSFYFSSTNNFPSEFLLERNEITSFRNKISNIINNNALDLIPEDFKLIPNSTGLGKMEEMFNDLYLIYSFAFLANKVIMFSNDTNSVDLEFSGHRDLTFKLNYKDMSVDADIVTSIYQWVYGGFHPFEKIGLARDTITKDCKIVEGEIKLDEESFSSLQTSYQMFQKENLEEYLKAKDTLSEMLISLTNQTSQIVSGLANSLKSNQLLIITFFTSIVILNAFSEGRFEGIFTKDITVISYAILLISFFFLLSSKWYAWMERHRYKVQYKRLKKMYKNILSREEIKEIFDSDEPYMEDLRFVSFKIWLFTITWLLEILIILGVILYLKICF